MNGRLRIFAAVVVLVAAAGCSKGGKGAGGPGGGGGGGFQRPPTPVEVAEVKAGPLKEKFSTVGSLEAVQQVVIAAEIDGTVERMPYDEGSTVSKGTLVAQLDDVENAATLRRAEALRDQRRSSHERVKKVVEANAAAPQDLDDSQAALAVAEADVAVARAHLDKTRIVAPFAGMIGPRKVDPGAYVRAGDGIAEIAALADLDVSFALPERYVGNLHAGAEVTVSTLAFPGEVVPGKVRVVDPMVDPSTRNIRVIARLHNPGGRFRPGMSANVEVVLAARDASLTVPAEAVFAEGTAFLVDKVGADGTVMPTPVTLGIRLPDVVEITSGLSAGDTVVRAGQQKLYPGAKVMPIGPGAPGQGGPGGPGAPGGAAPSGASGDAKAASAKPAEAKPAEAKPGAKDTSSTGAHAK